MRILLGSRGRGGGGEHLARGRNSSGSRRGGLGIVRGGDCRRVECRLLHHSGPVCVARTNEGCVVRVGGMARTQSPRKGRESRGKERRERDVLVYIRS